MHASVEERLARLAPSGGSPAFAGGRVGLEKEALRVTPEGVVSQRPHPRALGSALTNPYITTDYSEALLELITPPFEDASQTLACLSRLHRFVYANLDDDELLWATSMPCRVGSDESIPIAQYGSSNVGRMKHVYRRGLGHRYGRVMQTISGVHFNYSLPVDFWPAFGEAIGTSADPESIQSSGYFALIRNFQRFGWLVPFLFGSSPAVCRSFLGSAATDFLPFDRGTYHLPFATSLRMSDIGYKNTTQAGLAISYDDLASYVSSLTRAIESPYPDFERIGVVADGEYRQLNCNLLQIENEYYSFVRPKQVALSGEKPTVALQRRGVQYVEIRALDVNAFDPLGVGESEMRFMEAFLILCLLVDSPPISPSEKAAIDENQRRVACQGRDPELHLLRGGERVRLRAWAHELCAALTGVCEQLDRGRDGAPYRAALMEQIEAIDEPARLPSSRMLADMTETERSFFEFAMDQSRAHRDALRAAPLESGQARALEEEAERSLARQEALERDDDMTFEEYLDRYFSQTLAAAEASDA